MPRPRFINTGHRSMSCLCGHDPLSGHCTHASHELIPDPGAAPRAFSACIGRGARERSRGADRTRDLNFVVACPSPGESCQHAWGSRRQGSIPASERRLRRGRASGDRSDGLFPGRLPNAHACNGDSHAGVFDWLAADPRPANLKTIKVAVGCGKFAQPSGSNSPRDTCTECLRDARRQMRCPRRTPVLRTRCACQFWTAQL